MRRNSMMVIVLTLLPLAAATAPAQGDKKVRADRDGDALPAGALTRLGTLRLRHDALVTFVAFLPDGKTLLSAAQDGTVRLWDVRTGKERRRVNLISDPFLHRSQISISLSADGKVFAARIGNGVRIWNLSGSENRPQPGRTGWTTAVALAPDGKTMATVDLKGNIILTELGTGKQRSFQAIPKAAGRFTGLGEGFLFAPDGKMLVAGVREYTGNKQRYAIWGWDPAIGERCRRFEAANYYELVAPLFSPDGALLAWAERGGTVMLVNPATAKTVRRLPSAKSDLTALAFSPDGKVLYGKLKTAGSLVAWDVTTGKIARLAGKATRPRWSADRSTADRPLAVSADGKLLACAGESNVIRLLDAPTGKERLVGEGHRAAVFSLAYSRDGKALLTQGEDGTMRTWDPSKGLETSRREGAARDGPFLLSPDGRMLAVDRYGGIRLVNLDTGKEGPPLASDGGSWGQQFLFSPDGSLLAVRIGVDPTIRLFHPATRKELRPLGAPAQARPSDPFSPTLGSPLIFAPDGKVLAALNENGEVVLWEVANRRKLRRLRLPTGQSPVSGAFTPDGHSLALYLGEGGVMLWEVATGAERCHFGRRPRERGEMQAQMIHFRRSPRLGSQALRIVAPTPDGRTIALAADGKLRLWDVLTGKERRHFIGGQGEVLALAFSPDGRTLASGSADGTALVWDVANLHAPTQARELDERGLASCWSDLTADSGRAFKAIRALVQSPQKSVPFLRQRQRPVVPLTAQAVERLVADLDSLRFAVRDRAFRELEKSGGQAAPALRKALEGKPGLELRRRVQGLLDRLASATFSGEQLRVIRALEVLERVATPEARKLLQALAKGAPGALETTEAQAALDRLGK